jgi:phosphate transport system ATP-binding protein
MKQELISAFLLKNATKLNIEELMQEIQKEVTILIVTHNMGQAMRISSKSMFMYLGELVEYGDTATMFSNPSDERTKAYLTGKMG